MTELTLEGFAAFVREQDAERKINHGDWCDCAVGDYVGGDFNTSMEFAIGVLRTAAPGIYRILERVDNPDLPETYGQLQAALDEAGL